jgi:hypothetical protein
MGARRKGCISSFVYLPPSVPRASESLHCLSLRPRLCTFRGNDGQYSVVISEQLLLTSQRPARTMKMASWFFDNSDRRRCASGGSVFSQMANLRQDAGGGKARPGIGRGTGSVASCRRHCAGRGAIGMRCREGNGAHGEEIPNDATSHVARPKSASSLEAATTCERHRVRQTHVVATWLGEAVSFRLSAVSRKTPAGALLPGRISPPLSARTVSYQKWRLRHSSATGFPPARE